MFESYKIPISVKGAVFENGAVWLRKNERDEWELPGGKLDKGEQPEQTVARELEEELGFKTQPVRIIAAYVHSVEGSLDESNGVLVISYLCEIMDKVSGFETDGEAGFAQFKKFNIEELPGLNMPQFFKDAIIKAYHEKNEALQN